MSRPRRPAMSHALNAALRSKSRNFPLSLERLETREVFAIDVTTEADVVDEFDGVTSLREAINQANAEGGDVTINLYGGNYSIGLPDGWDSVRGDNFNEYGDFDIFLQEGSTLKFNGEGATIDGAGLDRVFQIFGSNVTFDNLTIRGGSAQDPGDDSDWRAASFIAAGGGVLAVGSDVTFSSVTITQNSADFSYYNQNETSPDFGDYPDGYNGDAVGGGVAGYLSTLTFENSTVDCNSAVAEYGGYAFGGGLYLADGTLTLTDSNVTYNRAEGADSVGCGCFTAGFAFGGGVAVTTDDYQYPEDGEYGFATVSVAGGSISNNRALGGDGASFDGEQFGEGGGDAFGGGVYLGAYTGATFDDVDVDDNHALGGEGGSLYLSDEMASSGNAYFIGGSGGNAYGGGVMVDENAGATFQNGTSLADNCAAGGAAGDVVVGYDGYVDGEVGFTFIGGSGLGGGLGMGGGAYVGRNGSATFDAVSIVGNYAVGGAGGDVDVQYPVVNTYDPANFPATAADYLIAAGAGSDAYGGGVAAEDFASISFRATTITGNRAKAGDAGDVTLGDAFVQGLAEGSFVRVVGAFGGYAFGGGVQFGGSVNSTNAVNFTEGSVISGNYALGGDGGDFNGVDSLFYLPVEQFGMNAGGGGDAYGGGIGAGYGASSASGSLYVADSFVEGNQAIGGAGGSSKSTSYYRGTRILWDENGFPVVDGEGNYIWETFYEYSMDGALGGYAGGGGVYLGGFDGEGSGTFDATFERTSISGNLAQGGAGGSYVVTAMPQADTVSFSANGYIDGSDRDGSGGAAFGGGVMIGRQSTADFTDVSLTGNAAQGGVGGDVTLGDANSIYAKGLWDVSTGGGDGGSGSGGGVSVGEEATATFTGSVTGMVVRGNTAQGGVGGKSVTAQAVYGPSTFYIYSGSGGDGYGGGVAGDVGAYINMMTSTVAGNFATGGRGGDAGVGSTFLAGLGSGTYLFVSAADGGWAGGGGIDLRGATLVFDFSTLSGNVARGGAGGDQTGLGDLRAAASDYGFEYMLGGGEGGDAYGGGVELISARDGEAGGPFWGIAEASMYNSTVSGNFVIGGAAGVAGTTEEYGEEIVGWEWVYDPNIGEDVEVPIYGPHRVLAGSGYGGGFGFLDYNNSGYLSLTYVTVAYNTAAAGADEYGTQGGWGGGIYAGGRNYKDNFEEGGGGGSARGSFSAFASFVGYSEDYIYLAGVILAQNTAVGPNSGISSDLAAYYITADYSLIGNADGALDGVGGTQQLKGTQANPLDPQLLPLANYGGLTETHRLLSTSPAVDPVFPADPEQTPGFSSFSAFAAFAPQAETDQRGVLRPQDGNGDGIATNDIGAFELEFTPEPPPREEEIPPTDDTPREPTEGALPVPPVLPPPVFIPFQTVPLAVGQVAAASYGTYTVFPNLKDVWVRLYRIEQRGGRKVTVLVTAIMVNNSDTGLRAALFALRKMPPGLYQITIDLAKSELIIWEGQYPKDVDAASRRLDQVENVLRTLQGPEQFRKELIEGAQPVPVTDPGSFFQAPTPSDDPALSETRTVLADSRWRQRAQIPGRSAEHESAPPAYVDMSIVWLGAEEEEGAPPVAAEPALAE